MASSEQRIRTEVRGHVLIITIDRADARNAFDRAAADQMEAALDLLDETQTLFLGVITGAGGIFSAGADLRAIARGERAATERRGGFGIFTRPPRKPLIAAVEGFALGGGFELCLACDLIVAADTARFGLPEVRHNALAIGGGLLRLQRRIPYHLAMEMTLTGQPRDAAFLERWGLINRLCPEGTALDVALDMAEQILRNGPLAIAASKEIIYRSSFAPALEDAFAMQEPFRRALMASADFTEGMAAFAQKRRPDWTGA